MSTVTLALSDELETAVAQRVRAMGATSREEYLLQLVEEDCAQTKIEAVLLERIDGPFVEFTPDDAWMERIREKAMKLRKA